MIYQKFKYLILALVGLVSIIMLWELKDLAHEHNFESFYPRNNEDTDFFMQYRKEFESDNDYILVGIQNNKGIFDQEFLLAIDELTRKLDTLEDVELVISPTNVLEFRRYSMHPALVEVPYIHVRDSTLYAGDSARIFQSYEMVNTIFSTRAPAIAVVVKHTPLLDDTGCRRVSNAVHDILNQYSFDEIHFAGRCEGQLVYIDLIERETLIFIGSSVLLIFIFLFLAYRSVWGIWMPLALVGLVILWTLGFMVLSDKKLDLLTNIIPTILMVIGISAVVHLLTNFLNLRRSGIDRIEALEKSIREVGPATLLTTITTMVGFLTLLNSSVQPVVDLGIYASIGLIISFFLTYTYFPAVLMIHPPLLSGKKMKDPWTPLLGKIDRFVQQRYRAILLITAVVGLIAGYGALQIKKDNFILDGLKYKHPQRVDFRFFRDNFAGARPFEMKVWLQDTSGSFFDSLMIRKIDRLHEYLEKEYGVGSLITPASIAKTANRIWYSGNFDQYKIPESPKRLKRLEQDLFRYSKQVNTEQYMKRNHFEARFVGKIPDWGSHIVNQKNVELAEFIHQNFNTYDIDYKITGSATLMDINTNFIAKNVIEGLLIAILIISLIVGFLFRSFKMALISIVPNVFPLLVCAGVMGYFEIDFNLSTSLIYIIAFGIAVDDSIHFLARLRYELNSTSDLNQAMSKTFVSTGKAIIVTTLILSGGFLTLCLSNFMGTFYIGLLICITLFVAVVCDLVLLPALLLFIGLGGKNKGPQ